MTDEKPVLNPNFFRREKDGSVRLRIRFSPEEAALIEEAAGETPLLLYIHRVLRERALYHIEKTAQETHKNRKKGVSPSAPQQQKPQQQNPPSST